MTPVVLLIERWPNGPPKLVTFLPRFWLLVPRAAGLIGVTGLVGTGPEGGIHALVDVLVTIVSIALGVLIGTAAHRVADAGTRHVAQTLPNVVSSLTPRRPPASGRGQQSASDDHP